MEKKSEVIIIRVTPVMKRKVEVLAKLSRRSLPNYLRLIIEKAINDRYKPTPPTGDKK